MKDNSENTSVKIADYNDAISGTKLKMVLRDDVMCAFGVPILNRCKHSTSEWISIDEIGFLEETCEPFKTAIRDLFACKHVIAVVRKQDLPFLNELRSRSDVFLVDLDQPFGNAGCVIMASGTGKRFGGNKLMADFLEKPLITRILDATDGLFTKQVVVTRHSDVANLCKNRDIPVVLHDFPHRNDTIRLGLKAIMPVDRCMFCPGDQPLLSKETIVSLLLSAVNTPEVIWRTSWESTPGTPVVFPQWAFAELLTLPERKGGISVIRNHTEKCKSQSVSNPWELIDTDTPEVLEKLQQHALNQRRKQD